MSTGCEFYADALVDRAAGRLDGEGTRQLERHLAGCEECRGALAVVEAVRATPLPVPDGLEARIRSAVREEVSATPAPALGIAHPGGGGPALRTPRRSSWRPGWSWGLPLAAAAALAVVWVGVGGPDGAAEPAVAGGAVEEEIEPFGAWPGADGMVAGDPLLSELTVEELEQLLEELES